MRYGPIRMDGGNTPCKRSTTRWLAAEERQTEERIGGHSMLTEYSFNNNNVNNDIRRKEGKKQMEQKLDRSFEGLIPVVLTDGLKDNSIDEMKEKIEKGPSMEIEPFDINCLSRTDKRDDVSFLNEHGEEVLEEDYPVNIVLREKRVLEGYVLGLLSRGSDRVVWMMIKGEPIFSENGEIDRVALYSMDITDLQRKQDDLQRRSASLENSIGKITAELEMTKRSLMHDQKMNGKVQLLTRTGSFEYDPKTRTIMGSIMFNDLLGLGGMIGSSIDTFLSAIHIEDREHMGSFITEAYEREGPQNIEVRYLHPITNVELTLLIRTVSIPGPTRDEIKMIGILQDISKQKIVKKELDSANSQMDALNQVMIDRESRVIEMKEEVNQLCKELGRRPRYENISN